MAGQEAAADHRRGRQRRGAEHAGDQQAPRRAAGRGGEGPGLRRSPQGDAPGHRRAHRGGAGHEGPGRRAGQGRPQAARPGQEDRDHGRQHCTIIEGAGATRDIQDRIAQIRREIESTDSDYDREKLQERLAKLAGGVAQVNVGAGSEAELKEKKARVEDALHATRAAVEEGIVPGGGVSFIRAMTASTQVRKQVGAMRSSAWTSSARPYRIPDPRPSPTTPARREAWWSRRSPSRRATRASTP